MVISAAADSFHELPLLLQMPLLLLLSPSDVLVTLDEVCRR
jgi:hypothetical protein